MNSTAPSRQTMGEINLSDAEKQDSYIAVILRMKKSGIMSHTTALEALDRVRGL